MSYFSCKSPVGDFDARGNLLYQKWNSKESPVVNFNFWGELEIANNAHPETIKETLLKLAIEQEEKGFEVVATELLALAATYE